MKKECSQLTGDSRDVVGSVCLQSVLDSSLLAIVCGIISSRVDVVAKPNGHIDLGLDNGLKLHKEVGPWRVEIKRKTRTTNAEMLQSAPYKRIR